MKLYQLTIETSDKKFSLMPEIQIYQNGANAEKAFVFELDKLREQYQSVTEYTYGDFDKSAEGLCSKDGRENEGFIYLDEINTKD